MFEDSRGRCRIGVIVPYTNTNLEPDLHSMRPAGVSFHFTRISSYADDGVPGASEMKQMGEAPMLSALDLLGAVRPDLMLYGCTSATLALGWQHEAAFTARLSAHCGLKVITTAKAIVDALKELAVSNIALCTPYDSELSDITGAYFNAAGFNVASTSNPEHDLDSHGQGAMPPGGVVELALKADHPQAEAIVMACTDMRAVECIAAIESKTRKPVISSNQALMYAAVKALEIVPESIPGILGRHRMETTSGANDRKVDQGVASPLLITEEC